MRTVEVLALTWDNIDLENIIIKINKTVYEKDKEEKGRWYLGTAKTIGSHREVYICDTLYLFLFEYKKLQSNSKRNRVEMVFTSKDGTYSGTDIIKYPFRMIHHELEIQCRFYDLRGSFATISLRTGVK